MYFSLNSRLHLLVCKATSYWLDCPGFESRQTYEIYLVSKKPRPASCPLNHLFNEHCGSFRGIKRPGREIDHSPPSSAEVKNEWSFTSSLPTYPHSVGRDNFFLFSLYSGFCSSDYSVLC